MLKIKISVDYFSSLQILTLMFNDNGIKIWSGNDSHIAELFYNTWKNFVNIANTQIDNSYVSQMPCYQEALEYSIRHEIPAYDSRLNNNENTILRENPTLARDMYLERLLIQG